jgi:16S rRNA (adenine1518-N6/adenine1519-N6)-dimethyltransferase
LINKIVENRDIIDEVVGMFQKEVVDRLISQPNNKEYGLPSIFTQCYYNVYKLFDVDPENFNPAPNVISSVCKFKRNEVINLNCDEKLFNDIVKRSFSCRIKMIKNNLKYNDFYKYIDPKYLGLRAENLSIEDVIDITNSIKRYLKSSIKPT